MYCFDKNLKYLRTRNNIEQMELAEQLGFKSSSAVSEWEKGVRIPNVGILSDIAEIFKVSIDDLMNEDLSDTSVFYRKKNYTKRIPLIGRVAAGTPILAEENIEDYFNIDKSLDADFALRVKGDSMIDAEIYNDNIAFIKKQEDLENGEIGVILIDDEATLKRFYKNDGSVILQPENKNYNPIILTKGDVHVLGKLIAVLKKF